MTCEEIKIRQIKKSVPDQSGRKVNRFARSLRRAGAVYGECNAFA